MPRASAVTFRLHGRSRRTTAVLALLHGGIGTARPTAGWQDPAYLRMLSFVPTVLTAGRGRVAVAVVRHAQHGWLRQGDGTWDGSDVQPGGALEHLLDGLSEVVPDGGSLHLVGHSSGGWAAIRALSDARVSSILGLAPYVAPREPLPTRQDARVVIAHGAMDSVTSARDSRAYVQRLVRAGIDAEFHDVSRGDHAMMLNAAAWQAIVHRYVGSCVSGTNR